jgi:hypothetical protein
MDWFALPTAKVKNPSFSHLVVQPAGCTSSAMPSSHRLGSFHANAQKSVFAFVSRGVLAFCSARPRMVLPL